MTPHITWIAALGIIAFGAPLAAEDETATVGPTESEVTWTSTDKVIRYYVESVSKAKGGVKFKAKPEGERYFYSVDGKENQLINYGQEVFVPTGSSLELTGKHANIKIQTIQDGTSVVVLAQLRIDNRSAAKKDADILRSAITINPSNEKVDLERAKAEPVFKSSKTFASPLPSSATPSARDQK
jgi:hypothetical protein